MSRYKLVVSDFHIGVGQLLEDGEINPFEYFIFDPRFRAFLEYYSNGDFKKAEVELILNGDFLNTLQVDYREQFLSEVTETVGVEKVRRIFAGHPELFDALRDFATAPNHRVVYIVGNHDPAVLWPAVQDEIRARLGGNVHFPGFSYTFDGVWIEHGHQYTPANRFEPGRVFVKNHNGDVILNLPWGGIWVLEYLNKIKRERVYVDRVQPFGRYLTLALFFDPLFAVPAFFRLVYVFAKQRFGKGRWRDPAEWARNLAMLLGLHLIPKLDADARRILAQPGYHTVIFGHNHQAAFRRYGREKLYVNTGTWNDIIHLDIQNLGRQRRMTYAFIDYPERRKPRTRLKIWKGTHQTEEDVIF